MGSTRYTIKKISPLQAIVFTGTISLLIIIAGTVGFFLTQHTVLEKVKKKQACYLDLVDFRGKLIEFGLSRNMEQSPHVAQNSEVLFLVYEKLLLQMQNAGLQPFASIQTARESWPAQLTGENLELFKLKLDKSIEKAKIESNEAADKLVVINEFFLFFILAVLLTLSITAGWILHNNYR